MSYRLIDITCTRHVRSILETRMWPDCHTCTECLHREDEATIFPHVDGIHELAVHEAGHAVAYSAHGIIVDHISIIRNERFAAYTNTQAHDQGSIGGLVGLLAGFAAVRVWLDRAGLLDDAALIDLAMTSRTDTLVAADVAHAVDVATAWEMADLLAKDRWDAIDRVAEALLDRHRLDGADVTRLAGIGCVVAR